MAERAFLCPIVESVDDQADGGRFFRPKLPDLPEGTRVSSTIPCDPKTGLPSRGYALVAVECDDFAKIDADDQIEKLDSVPSPCDAAELDRLLAARKTG